MVKKLNKEVLKKLETTKLINYNNNVGDNLALMHSGKIARSDVFKGIVELKKPMDVFIGH